MIFTGTALKDATLVDIEKHEDERGFFARSWCRREFEARGLNPNLAQCNISFNPHKGTLRGMHFQVQPHEEAKLVRCTRGSLFDAIVDLRPDSPTYKKHLGVVLTADNRRMLYVPEGFAHGFLTLEDATEVFYQISEFYAPESQRGVRWNDPAFSIEWPAKPKFISERDQSYPNFDGREKGMR
jgi:dTDP-4-dehydrorhamnose 3,5-epimerase